MRFLITLIALAITLVGINWIAAPSSKPAPQQTASASEEEVSANEDAIKPSQAVSAVPGITAKHPDEIASSSSPPVVAALPDAQKLAAVQPEPDETATSEKADDMEVAPLPQVAHPVRQKTTATVSVAAAVKPEQFAPEQTAKTLNKENMARMGELDRLFEQ